MTTANLSFVGGEISDLMMANPNQPHYQAGCTSLKDAVCIAQGAATRRPGWMYLGMSGDQTMTNNVRVEPFVFSTSESRVLEYYHNTIRVWKEDALVQSGGGDYEVTTHYTSAKIPDLRHKQSADVVYTASPLDPPAKLTRADDNDWTPEDIDFLPDTPIPTGLAITSEVGIPTTNQRSYRYKVTAVDATDAEESIPSAESNITTSVLNSVDGNYNTITWWANAVAPLEYRVYRYESGIFGYIGTTQPAANMFAGSTPQATEAVNLIDGHTYVMMMEGTGTIEAGTGLSPVFGTAAEGIPLIFVSDTTGAVTFTIKTLVPTRWQLTDALLFDDDNIVPDSEDSPPSANDPFDGPNNYPSLVYLVDQRVGWAAPISKPFTLNISPAALFESLSASVPPSDSDAIEVTLAANQADGIQWVEGDRALMVGTTGYEWSVGKTDEPITPANATQFTRQGGHGSESIPALVTGDALLFVERGGDVVREMVYNFSTDKYNLPDLSIRASHLLDGKSIVSWCYQLKPFSIVWMVLDDGTMLGMTYMREHEVVAWHHHTTGSTIAGTFVPDVIEHICCVPGEGYDRVHAVIKRLLPGSATPVRTIERMENYYIRETDLTKAFFVDSGVKFDGAALTTALDGTLSAVTGAAVTLTTATTFFEATDAGEVAWGPTGSMTITTVDSATQVTGVVTADFAGTTLTGGLWAVRRSTLTAVAPHLIGATVRIWADGVEQAEKVVGAAGTVILDTAADVGCLGLRMISDVKPVRPEVASAADTTLTRIAKVSAAKLRLHKSTGVKAGRSDSVDDLQEILAHDLADPVAPRYVEMEDVRTDIDTGFTDEWGFTIRADSPGPMTILASVYDVELAKEL